MEYPRQLIGDSSCLVNHNGNRYDVCAPDDLGVFALSAIYLEDTLIQYSDSTMKRVAYRMRLTGGHAGAEIDVFMVNPHDEMDDESGGLWFTWDELLWADDRSLFDNAYLLDTYTDSLRDELTEIAKNWTL